MWSPRPPMPSHFTKFWSLIFPLTYKVTGCNTGEFAFFKPSSRNKLLQTTCRRIHWLYFMPLNDAIKHLDTFLWSFLWSWTSLHYRLRTTVRTSGDLFSKGDKLLFTFGLYSEQLTFIYVRFYFMQLSCLVSRALLKGQAVAAWW